MTETTATESAPTGKKAKEEKEETLGSFLIFLVKLAVVALIFRTFIFSPFTIPSESMLPRLLVGDYLLAAKWPYGYSNKSLPSFMPIMPGRIFAHQPERGDVVIFKHPVSGEDYVKRVIGLPGEQIQMIAGVVHIDGKPVKKEKIGDFVLDITSSEGCREARFVERRDDGSFACRYPRYRETLPNGVTYDVLDFGITPQDTTDPVVVPEGTMFLMGDNRDNSLDSRFPALPGQGVGLVPQSELVGEATIVLWSVDESANWLKPWTWFTGTRWERIGYVP